MEIRIEEAVSQKQYRKSVEKAFRKGADIEFISIKPGGYPREWRWNPDPQFNWKSCNYRVKAQTVMDNTKTAQETIDKAIDIVETILSEREETHGNFRDHARCTQRLKTVLRDELEIVGKTLTMEQQEALDMIFHKIGRMVAGDADFIDHWDDLAGYSSLVARVLRGKL